MELAVDAMMVGCPGPAAEDLDTLVFFFKEPASQWNEILFKRIQDQDQSSF